MILDITDAHKARSNRDCQYDTPENLIAANLVAKAIEENKEAEFDGP